MIKYVKGNILDSQSDFITIPVNCVGVMGAGLALEFKKKYPIVFQWYKEDCQKSEIAPGIPVFYNQVCLFPTKDHWKNPSKLEWIDIGLAILSNRWYEEGDFSIALPALGCGLGGLNWESEVKPLIEKYFSKHQNIDVEVYEPR